MSQKKANKEQRKKIVSKKLEKLSLFERANNFFQNKDKTIFWILLVVMAIFSLLLFDMKPSDGGDDSSYVLAAYRFIHNFEFPGFEGPLYPIFLSIFIALFGVKLSLLKLVSLICMLVFFYLLYQAYKNVVPRIVLFPVLILTSVNSWLLYFASQTYTEAFFMMLQAALFLIVSNYFISDESKEVFLKKDYKKILLLGFWLAVVSLARNIGLASAIAVLTYFILMKQWKIAFYVLISFAMFMLLFQGLKRGIINKSDIQIQAMGASFLSKDYYNPAKGNEDIAGFIQRFIDNSNLYLSRHLYIFLGLKSTLLAMPLLTIFTYLFFAVCLYAVFRKNKFILFSGIYVAIMCSVTFVVLQKIWDQWRVIVVYLPYILVFWSGGLYYMLEKGKAKKYQFAFLILCGIIFLTSFKDTLRTVDAREDVLRKNLSGDMLYGFPPDWKNFIEMSKWANENLPKDKMIASRKAGISFVYTGREFYPIYKVPNIALDTLTTAIAKDTGTICAAVLENDFFDKQGSRETVKHGLEQVYFGNGIFIRAFISGTIPGAGNDMSKKPFEYFVYAFPKNKGGQFLKYFSDNHVPVITDLNKRIAEWQSKNYDLKVYDPDYLLRMLKHDNVRYIIVSNMILSVTAKRVQENITNTIGRFVRYIELKYPIMKQVHKIGNVESESSKLIEIQYERLNTKVVKI